jgi:1-deoxy-D-xylulose-5-phosphate reductoisomerase
VAADNPPLPVTAMDNPSKQKRVAVLGSTGSIGTSTLSVISHLGEPYRAVALSAHRQGKLLLEQVRDYRPAAVSVTDEPTCQALCGELKALGAQCYCGPEGLVEMVKRDDVDIVLAAIVGSAGLPAVLAAIEAGKTLALANKEALVVAGSLVIPMARKKGVALLPVDSEHSAIFQAMQSGRLSEVKRVILTASGGPFRKASIEQMEKATLDDALNHPTWRMGSKISIDSATMFNKALELIEACWLFDVPPEKVEIVIHPDSVVHSMVEYVDGSVIAQLSPPDMRTPIQYALTYPHRVEGATRKLDLQKAFTLHFEPPDDRRFPALRLAYHVAREGGTYGAVLNGANEAAVGAFAKGCIPFGQIARIVERTIDCHRGVKSPSLEDLMEADRWAREKAQSLQQAVACQG